MANSSALEMIWVIQDVLPGWKYKVKLAEMDFVVTWHKSGNMRRNNIAIMVWDYIKLEINEYENTVWRITYRYKYPPTDFKAALENPYGQTDPNATPANPNAKPKGKGKWKGPKRKSYRK